MLKSTHKYLVTIPYGVGDVIYIGLAVVDQIIKNDPLAFGKIDFLCNLTQAEIVASDPRIIPITIERELFPTQYKSSWFKSFFIVHPRTKVLLHYFKKRQYDAIFPGNMAFRFLYKIGPTVMKPHLSSVLKDFHDLRKYKDAQASRQVRRIVNNFFNKTLSDPQIDEPINLFVEETVVKDINEYATSIKKKTNTKHLVLIAPDTTSNVTRPPVKLLVRIFEYILKRYSDSCIILLPSYDSDATYSIYNAIPKKLLNRIINIPAYPHWNLMHIAALTDIVDLVISGDTGVMHLAAAEKIIVKKTKKTSKIKARNSKNTIAIFGGTNPGLYGYPRRTLIIGRGNSVQKRIRPGLLKEGYNPKDRDYFSHISVNKIKEEIDKLLLQ